jgi:hypothetical protein
MRYTKSKQEYILHYELEGLSPGAMYPIVPGMLVNVIEFSSPTSNLEMPKSDTWAVMSSSSKILLGFKSQCRTASKC